MSNDLVELKKRIFEDDRIEEVLELLECWNVRTEQRGTLYVAGLPDWDTNDRAVQIRDEESLSSAIRTVGIKGDIFNIVNFIVHGIEDKTESNNKVHLAKFWLCDKLNYPEYIDAFYRDTDGSPKNVPKTPSWVKATKKKKRKESIKNEVKEFDYESVYGIIPSVKWIEEGLDVHTQRAFKVGYDVAGERITFPVFNAEGELIGVKGRYIGADEKIHNSKKYIYVVKCNKSIELFNFHKAKVDAIARKEIIIIEGAKSVMLATQYGYLNVVSMEGDELSEEQVKLLKTLPLDTKYIFAMDKDKSKNEVANVMKGLTGRLRYAILDIDNKLEHKDSPMDKGKEVWEYLYKNNKYKMK